MLTFTKKICDYKKRDPNYLVNENDKEYLKEAKKNLEKLKSYVVSNLLLKEEILSELNHINSSIQNNDYNEHINIINNEYLDYTKNREYKIDYEMYENEEGNDAKTCHTTATNGTNCTNYEDTSSKMILDN